MRSDNQIVHSLWIGRELSTLELLTLRSFLYVGHEFHLWLYDSIDTPIPERVVVRDASQLLPRKKVFRYKNGCQFSPEKAGVGPHFGKGSYAGFSDIFRYKLLYEVGGWWADMDVTALKRLDFDEPYVFRDHGSVGVVGNIMKCPPKSELMKKCFERASQEVNEHSVYWSTPIQILADSIQQLALSHFIKKGISNEDTWNSVRPFFEKPTPIPESFYILHWCNEAMKVRGMNGNRYTRSSTYERLLKRYGVTPSQPVS